LLLLLLLPPFRFSAARLNFEKEKF